MIDFELFRGNSSTVVIPASNKLNLSSGGPSKNDIDSFELFGSSSSSCDSPTLLRAATAAVVQDDADLETDASPDAGPKTIQSKFLECISNQQTAAAREQALTRIECRKT